MKTPLFAVALTAFVSLGYTAAHAALATVDNFSSVTTDGTLLTTVSGWSGGTGANTASVSTEFGYGDSKGARIPSNGESYALTLSGGNALTAADGPLEFKFNFRGSSGADAYQYTQIMIGQTGGVNGLVVEFNGGTSNASTDNSIRVSSGTGVSWSNVGLGSSLANSAWVSGDWYEVTINFSLLTTGIGQNVTGTLSVYDQTNSSYLIQNTSIAGTGTTGGAFNTANTVQLKNSGSARAFDVSDIRIGTAIPEPSSAAILAGASILGFAVLRRRSHQALR
ncbi:MAG: PEP-CTERM sorting domain-containing protein [Verrucomicrobiota bacterium]